MKNYPSAHTIESVTQIARHVSVEINGNWYPARPVGFHSFWSRISLAWEVFTGRADVLRWPGDQS